MIPKIVKRCRRFGLGNAFRYTVYRFETARSLGRLYNKVFRTRSEHDLKGSIFQGYDAGSIVEKVREDAFFIPLTLPAESVREVFRYAEEARCVSYVGDNRYEYPYREKAREEGRAGKTFVLAHCMDPAASSKAVAAIERDPLLLEVCSRYLGCEPQWIETRLWWSFPVEATEGDRLGSKQTVLFHYDLESYGFLYFNFYLTDVDSLNGPHVVVRGSHKRKKLRLLLASANQPDDRILRCYGAENVLTIQGKAGLGFVEDSFCFHKATPPASKSRLFLQVRMTAGKKIESF